MSGSVARPRAQILIAGIVQPGLVSCEINSSNFGRGDTFLAQIAPPPKNKNVYIYDKPL